MGDSSRSANRHVPASTEVETARARSILEDLISTVTPENASGFSLELISEFGSVGGVLAESREALARVIGDSVDVLNLLVASRSLLVEGLRTAVPRRIVSSTDRRLINYLVGSMGPLKEECMRVLFLNNSNHLIADEVLAAGSVRQLSVHPRQILKRSLELGASAVILVHNHPSGSARPSDADIEFTQKFVSTAATLEVNVVDHIIVTASRWSSFRERGML